jgi:hypothetical protein
MFKIGMKTLMVVLFVGVVAKASARTAHVLTGRAKEVDSVTHSIVIQTESGVETLPFTDSTKMLGLGLDSKVKDIQPGDSLIVLCSGKGGKKQAQDIKNMKLSHKIETLEGEVIRVYKSARLMFIKMPDGKSKVLHIADHALLVLNGQLVSPAELAVAQGESVKVYYTADRDFKTVQAMEGRQPWD